MFGKQIPSYQFYLFVGLLSLISDFFSSFCFESPAGRVFQVAAIKRALPHVCVIANGNVQCFEDAERNRATTGADGIMSAEVRKLSLLSLRRAARKTVATRWTVV